MPICARQHKQRASRCCKTEGRPIQIHVPSEEPKDGFCRRPRFRDSLLFFPWLEENLNKFTSCLVTHRFGRPRRWEGLVDAPQQNRRVRQRRGRIVTMLCRRKVFPATPIILFTLYGDSVSNWKYLKTCVGYRKKPNLRAFASFRPVLQTFIFTRVSTRLT
jgi:hypothetical protein